MANGGHVDVLVVGGGPGGTPAAMALARGGKRVLLAVAGRGLGGACLFEGCIPSKIFRETAARRLEIGRSAEFGLKLTDSQATVDWPAVQSRRHRILNQRAQGALEQARAIPGLEVVFGRARLGGPREALIEAGGERRRAPGRGARGERHRSGDRRAHRRRLVRPQEIEPELAALLVPRADRCRGFRAGIRRQRVPPHPAAAGREQRRSSDEEDRSPKHYTQACGGRGRDARRGGGAACAHAAGVRSAPT
jgi:hypothetical protein